MTPCATLVRQFDTHRLIPAKYTDDGASVLAELAEGDRHLQDIFDLDHATNDRLLAENGRGLGIGVHELVFDVPGYRMINASFCHPHPLGSRFNGPERGAWYAAFELATSQAEIAFHKSVELAEVQWFDQSVTYDDYLADISAELHDLRDAERFSACLDPNSYVRSQALAGHLFAAGSLGVVYPSVRHRGGTCVACFRPAIVGNVRKSGRYRFTWDGTAVPSITLEC